MRFNLIDRITDLQPGKSIVAIKNLSLAEEYLADHFPGFPVMPGVLMVEALTQAGAWLIRHSEDFRHSTVLLKSARALKFVNFVTPGKMLQVSLEVHGWAGDECTLKASGTVDGQTAVAGRLVLERFNLRDRNPAAAQADEIQNKHWRELFPQLWTAPVSAGKISSGASAGT
ncbi:MAG TPA: beta-hydroxyacyl-ACP dehydratase [Planctomycetaceae bacterium]|nr:beta-hydroxyacyl-ACP dehydratase [Planctomycetaceae bacterium]